MNFAPLNATKRPGYKPPSSSIVHGNSVRRQKPFKTLRPDEMPTQEHYQAILKDARKQRKVNGIPITFNKRVYINIEPDGDDYEV